MRAPRARYCLWILPLALGSAAATLWPCGGAGRPDDGRAPVGVNGPVVRAQPDGAGAPSVEGDAARRFARSPRDVRPETRDLASPVVRSEEGIESDRARRSSERAELRTWARTDPESFAAEARVRLAGTDTPLAEKAEYLRAAAKAHPVLGCELAGAALSPDGAAPPPLREVALATLVGNAGGTATARNALRGVALADRRLDDETRRRAALALFAVAPEDELAWLSSEAERSRDEVVWHESLRGLARNASPRAREILEEVARTRSYDPAAQAVAAAALEEPSEPAVDDSFNE